MASTNSALPSCESDISGTAKYVCWSESESPILKIRFGSKIKCLCEPRYNDKFKQQLAQQKV